MRLLVAEDDTRLLRSLTHILERERYLVDGVDNGEDALTYAETAEYDGLVLDIMMPGLDGVTVLKRLRQKGVAPRRCFSPPRQRWPTRWRDWTPGPTTTW